MSAKVVSKRGRYDPPEPYVVRFDDQAGYLKAVEKYGLEEVECDPDLIPRDLENFETLAAARRFAKKVFGATIYKRVGVHEDTSPGWPSWYHTYDWEEESVE